MTISMQVHTQYTHTHNLVEGGVEYSNMSRARKCRLRQLDPWHNGLSGGDETEQHQGSGVAPHDCSRKEVYSIKLGAGEMEVGHQARLPVRFAGLWSGARMAASLINFISCQISNESD